MPWESQLTSRARKANVWGLFARMFRDDKAQCAQGLVLLWQRVWQGAVCVWWFGVRGLNIGNPWPSNSRNVRLLYHTFSR